MPAKPTRSARPPSAPRPAFESHDHHGCVADALGTVDADCAARGLKLTPLRRRVLEILLEQHRAMGAYDVLARLDGEGFGSQPPVAYRALDFLVKNGFAHKIQRMNAFVACCHPGERHQPAFLICRACQLVMEAPLAEAFERIDAGAAALGFAVERSEVEIEGLCAACAAGAGAAAAG